MSVSSCVSSDYALCTCKMQNELYIGNGESLRTNVTNHLLCLLLDKLVPSWYLEARS